MKILRITSLLLFVLTLTAFTLPVPARLATSQAPATGSELTRDALLRYRWLRDTELPQLLAWLHDWGPFTQPMPGLLPDTADPGAVAEQ